MEMTQNVKLRARQVSKEYNICIATVWNYAKQGLLTPIKITKGVTVFDRKEVDNLFSGNRNDKTLVT